MRPQPRNARPQEPETVHRRWKLADLARRHRAVAFALVYGALAVISVTLSFLIRFEIVGLDPDRVDWGPWLLPLVAVTVPVRLAAFWAFGRPRASWRYASLADVPPMAASILVGSAVAAGALELFHAGPFPRSVLVVDALVYMVLCAFALYAYRRAVDIFEGREPCPGGRGGFGRRTRVVIVGAGEAGVLTLEAMRHRGLSCYRPVALVDDDPLKQGITLLGVPVAGSIDSIAQVADRTRAEAIVLALPSAGTPDLFRIAELCRGAGLPLKTVPDLGQILASDNRVERLRDFSLDELLERRPVRPDVPAVGRLVGGRCVLVTGAAGSIGSELCRQIVDHGAGRLVCLDRDENGLFRLEQELRARNHGAELVFFLADMRDRGRMEALFAMHRPEQVYHAAAYKHVPILQFHPVEAVRNNVGGTRNLVELARARGVRRFVMISTDKAVNPTSVMGATKQVAEKIVLSAGEDGGTIFNIIRFGNVLGSNGSVVELFRKQIRQGGPVTVTHPDMERYFMTIAEAVHLVLTAAAMGRGGDVFVLDMGEPVRIDHLARQMIILSGLTPDVDVPIVYTGLRPGEKLFEELWTPAEKPLPTGTPGVLAALREPCDPAAVETLVAGLLAAAEAGDMQRTWSALLELVPRFQGRTNGEAVVPPDPETVRRRCPVAETEKIEAQSEAGSLLLHPAGSLE